MADTLSITHDVVGPFMDTSVPPAKVKQGAYPIISGVDPRYAGELRKFYGMQNVLDLRTTTALGMSTLGGISRIYGFRVVTFQKTGTSTFYRGFVVMWNPTYSTSQQQIDLIYTEDGVDWASYTIWATGTNIDSSAEFDVATHENFLYLFVEGKAPQTVYYDEDLTALTKVDMGPGIYAATLPAMTLSGTSTDTTMSYFLSGSGTYQIAFRLYSSTRGVYSALSTPVTVTLDLRAKSKAVGVIYLDSAGGDSGKLVDGDILTIGGRTYEVNDTDTSSDVDLGDIASLSQENQIKAVVDVINADASGSVYATYGLGLISLEARTRGSEGNAITLAYTEAGAGSGDISLSGTTLTGGGGMTTLPDPNCKITTMLPQDGATWNGTTFEYDTFSAAFDTVEVFRSIDLGSTTKGAILYKEEEFAMPASDTLWNAKTVVSGTTYDEALVFFSQYNPSTDIVKAPPTSGTAGRYQGVTLVAQNTTDKGGLSTFQSSLTQDSAEYFSTYNERKGSYEEGRPKRYIVAGDSCILLSENAVANISKAGWENNYSMAYTVFHYNRGLVAKMAAHTIGNSIIYMGQSGLYLLNSNDMNVGQLQVADGLISDSWTSYLSMVTSSFDAKMGTSFFLCYPLAQIIMVNHNTQSVSLLDYARFAATDGGLDVTGLGVQRAYFITSLGRIVTPDYAEAGNGTMFGLTGACSAPIRWNPIIRVGKTYTVAVTVQKTTSTFCPFDVRVGGAKVMFSGDYTSGGTITGPAGSTAVTITATHSISTAPSTEADFLQIQAIGATAATGFRVTKISIMETGTSTELVRYGGTIAGPLVQGWYEDATTAANGVWTYGGSTGLTYVHTTGTDGSILIQRNTFVEGTTSGTAKLYLSDGVAASTAMFGATIVVYSDVSGPYKGVITTVDTTNNIITAVFSPLALPSNARETGGATMTGYYHISPVPFSVRFPVQRVKEGQKVIADFQRVIYTSMSAKFGLISNTYTVNPLTMYLGAYRNGTLVRGTLPRNANYPSMPVNANPSLAVGALRIDGIDIEPYIEYYGTGVKFNLTCCEFRFTIGNSEKVS